MNHELAATETDIRWLDDLIQAERLQVHPGSTTAKRSARPRRRRTVAPPRPVAQKERAT